MGSRRRANLAGGIILSMALCLGFSEQKPQWKGTISDQGEVVVVKNPKKPAFGEGAFTLEEELSIGKPGGTEGHLFVVSLLGMKSRSDRRASPAMRMKRYLMRLHLFLIIFFALLFGLFSSLTDIRREYYDCFRVYPMIHKFKGEKRITWGLGICSSRSL